MWSCVDSFEPILELKVFAQISARPCHGRILLECQFPKYQKKKIYFGVSIFGNNGEHTVLYLKSLRTRITVWNDHVWIYKLMIFEHFRIYSLLKCVFSQLIIVFGNIVNRTYFRNNTQEKFPKSIELLFVIMLS